MKIAPERLFLDAESQVYRVAGRKLKDSNIEYIRADLARPPERHQRLVEAAKGMLTAVTVLCGDECSCFSTCSLANECDEDSGNECLLAARLKAALEGEG